MRFASVQLSHDVCRACPRRHALRVEGVVASHHHTHGECDAAEPLSGFYCREARVLSMFRIEINGSRPWVSEAAATSPERLDFNYVYPEITKPGGGGTGQAGDEEGVDASGLPERSLDLRISFMPALDGLDVALAITNRARKPLTFDVRCVVDADFADIQEAIRAAARADLSRHGVCQQRNDRSCLRSSAAPIQNRDPGRRLGAG